MSKSWIMKVYFDRKVLVGFFLALGILIFLGIASYRNSKNSNLTGTMVSHTNDVLYHIETLHAIHLEIEYEFMRYLVTGDSAFSLFFHNKLNDAMAHFLVLQDLVKDNASQKARIDGIRLLGREKVTLINQTLDARNHSEDAARNITLSPSNSKLLAAISTLVANMKQEEKALLDKRVANNQKEVSKFYSTFTTLIVVITLIIVILFLAVNATLRARLHAEKALQIASEEINGLYHSAPCGYHSLNSNGVIVEMNKTWLGWIGYEREEVIGKMTLTELLTPKSQEFYKSTFPVFKSQGFVHNLEFEIVCKNATVLFVILNATAIRDENGEFIKSRSTVFNITDRRIAEQKVVEANRELEAFTYSVSHDLRAPLRAIGGYSKILEEDFANQWDAESKRILQIIRNNASRMGQLIEDLLNFSRIGRKDLERSRLNMNAMVEHIKQELLTHENNRTIEFKINPLQDVHGDTSMMRQVWINLISNALKYSRKQHVSRIEIGCQQADNLPTFYIRDNGVGFDMMYANKLFGVFQRLHKMEEFDGTGVGLALVQRIVSRHGGKIWAEAQVNHGATFFFYIPGQNAI